MNVKEAQEEANMLRTKIGIAPETGKKEDHDQSYVREMFGHDIGEEPSPEDYDHALEAVEEMKRLSEEEPKGEKLMNELKRIASKTKITGIVLINLFAIAGGSGSFELSHQRRMQELEDASQRLKDLKKEAEKFEK